MFDFYYITVIFVSLGAAFFSGLLGIGGGIIIFPAFMYLFPFLGFTTFTINEITGIAAAQSLAGVFFAFMRHRKFGNINIKLIKIVLPVGIIGAITGAVSARFISEKFLLIMYIFLLVMATILILIQKTDGFCKDNEYKFDRPVITNFFIFINTIICGALGFAGAALFIPILNYFCKVPIKTAISTTTLIVFITASFVFAGKVSVGLVPFDFIIYIIIGSFFGAAFGTKLNKILSSLTLKRILLFVILVVGIRIFLTILEY